ncbi:hypothetical protein H8356DRAFT_1437835 [Neocallimastix lanati (nom. inval.)]|nr:hypothetical protein H8356DRAFT_1437835 [Neocallimastix sp. JGI-2020a]
MDISTRSFFSPLKLRENYIGFGVIKIFIYIILFNLPIKSGGAKRGSEEGPNNDKNFHKSLNCTLVNTHNSLGIGQVSSIVEGSHKVRIKDSYSQNQNSDLYVRFIMSNKVEYTNCLICSYTIFVLIVGEHSSKEGNFNTTDYYFELRSLLLYTFIEKSVLQLTFPYEEENEDFLVPNETTYTVPSGVGNRSCGWCKGCTTFGHTLNPKSFSTKKNSNPKIFYFSFKKISAPKKI